MIFEIFVSYAWIDDKKWVDQFVTALRSRGLAVFKDDDSVSEWGSQDLMDELMEKLRSSRMFIAVITPRFYNSPHCGAELTAASDCAEALGEPRRVVPVTRKAAPEQVKPRALKRLKLIRSEEHDIDEIADVVSQIALDIRSPGDMTCGAAPEPATPACLPDPPIRRTPIVGRGLGRWALRDASTERQGMRARERCC